MNKDALFNAPQDRHILVKHKQYSYFGYDWTITGTVISECWFNKGEWVIWCGDEKTSTTEFLDPITWCEIPTEWYK